MHRLLDLATIWLCGFYILLHVMEDAPELPWHD
jgi:hypothetical protein